MQVKKHKASDEENKNSINWKNIKWKVYDKTRHQWRDTELYSSSFISAMCETDIKI